MWAFLGVLLLVVHEGVAQRHDTDLLSFVTVSCLADTIFFAWSDSQRP